MALLKKSASGVLASFPCSRIASTLRAQNWLRPCWTNFFEQRLAIEMLGFFVKNMAVNIHIIQHSQESHDVLRVER